MVVNYEDIQKKLEQKFQQLRKEYLMTDNYIKKLKEQKKTEWLRKGYSPELIEKAFLMADEWIYSIAKAYLPSKPELQKQLIRTSYPKALSAAQNWLEAVIK